MSLDVAEEWIQELIGDDVEVCEQSLAACIALMGDKVDGLEAEVEKLEGKLIDIEDERDEKERLECEVDDLRGRVASADQIVRAFGDPEDSGHEGFVTKMADFLFTQRGVPCRLFTDTGEEVERYAVERDLKALFHEAGKA